MLDGRQRALPRGQTDQRLLQRARLAFAVAWGEVPGSWGDDHNPETGYVPVNERPNVDEFLQTEEETKSDLEL